jgi:predicted transposase YdaD
MMDEDAYDMAAQYSKDKEVMLKVKDYYKKEERVNMGGAISELIERGRLKGVEQGRNDIVRKLLSKGYTCEEIADILDMEEAAVQKIQAKALQTTY